MKNICKFILTKVLGWTIYGQNEISSRSVVAVIPHTSYLDGVIGYLAMKTLNVNFKVMSAEWLFFFPFKYVMKYILHAFPVGQHSGNAIKKSLQMFEENDKMNLVICPEGQLAPTDKWNAGFFLIAKKANVPVDVVIFDYWNKNIYIRSYDISNMSKDDMFGWMNRDAREYAVAKYPEKFKLHSFGKL